MKENIFLDDIINNHSERMQVLRRYYPFFRLWDNGLNLYKDGQYTDLDMPYITMAVLRFFLEENSFNDRLVSYEMYSRFMKELLERDFEMVLPESERQPLVSYIFDKLCNEGKPFSARWFDPAERKYKTIRIKLIESRFENEQIVYNLTSDAIAFYLDTKEIRDESPMSIEQVLLGKMVMSRDFKGGLEMIRRINQEVTRMVTQKDEIVRLFGYNVFEGAHALEVFSKQGMAWFEEEEKMFAANQELVDQAMQMVTTPNTRQEIVALDTELKRAMHRHSELLSACTQLQVQADELIRQAKHSRFRRRTDFGKIREALMETDDMRGLEAVIEPLFGLKTKRTLNLSVLDNMLDYKTEDKNLHEQIEDTKEQHYVYEDDLAEARIQDNFDYLLKVLFEQLLEKRRVDLKYLTHLYMMKFGEEIYQNGDFYAFLVHLSQKSDYDMQTLQMQQDTFLEGIIAKFLQKDGMEKYKKLQFHLIYENTPIRLTDTFEVSDIIFERTDK